MLEEKWITDRIPTEKFPHYTRANAGEVLADPVTPLGWTFGWESGIVLGCRDGFVSYGVFDADEYGDPPETFGLFGGYFYNCLTSARMMGVRMPGVTPEAIDDAYFDAHPDVPPYVAEDWHESERHSEKLAETGAYLLSATEHPPIEEHKKIGNEIRASRPNLNELDNQELLARARSLQPHLISMFEQHVWASLGASNGPGILGALFTVPLRRALILKAQLRFPEGVATAAVLKTGHETGSEKSQQSLKIIGISALVGGFVKLGELAFSIWSSALGGAIAIKGAIFGMGASLSPSLFSVGYIVGRNIGILAFTGGLISWAVAIPIYSYLYGFEGNNYFESANVIWNAKIRYLGVGAMVVGGIWSVIQLAKPLIESIQLSLKNT